MTPTEIRFATDGMLQSLGTWLRVLGYDCAAPKTEASRVLLERAVADDRVFLTRNFHLTDNLPQRLLKRAQVVHVLGEHLPEQLREIACRFSLDTERFLFTRCVECNEPLARVSATKAAACVPRDVLERERDFWHCARCGKTFWRGSHVRNSIEHLQDWLGAPSSR